MTIQQWLFSLTRCALCAGLLWYAVYYIQSGWGLLILLSVYLSGFWLLVDTVDLLFGRWIRRGTAVPLPLPPQPVGPRRVRRIIFEEEEIAG